MADVTSPVRLVFITVPDEACAERIATTLVDERLVACVNILPAVKSIYRWQGKIERGQELLLVGKTTAARLPTVISRTKELHPYEVPEVLGVAVDRGLPAYIAWVVDETAPIVI